MSPLSVQNRPKRPALVGAAAIGFIAICAVVGGIAADVLVRNWPTGGTR